MFDFWAQIDNAEPIHPADAATVARVQPEFDWHCLPIPYMGPLATAKVVLLFLNPGLCALDHELAATEAGRHWYAEQRTGHGNLPNNDEHADANLWLNGILGQFGTTQEAVADTVAILDLCAYHSQNFRRLHEMTAALQSCRVSTHWAQNSLFPRAERGEVVVVCLRSPLYWGLKAAVDDTSGRYGQYLFAPRTTQGGHMNHGSFRDHIVKVVRAHLGL